MHISMDILNVRTSDLVLDRVLNPAQSPDIGNARPDDILEACGLIPDFFAKACLSITAGGEDAPDCRAITAGGEDATLDGLAVAMDNLYGCGGFNAYPYGGTVATDGTYASEYDEDPDMPPLCRFGYEGRFFCYVYEYGITAIRDNSTGQTKIARFD